jgi:hypothetical protein
MLILLNSNNSEKLTRYDSVYVYNDNDILDSIDIKQLINQFSKNNYYNRGTTINDTILKKDTINKYDHNKHLRKKTIKIHADNLYWARIEYFYDNSDNLIKLKCVNYKKKKITSKEIRIYKYNIYNNLISITNIEKGIKNQKKVFEVEYGNNEIKTFILKRNLKYEDYTFKFK